MQIQVNTDRHLNVSDELITQVGATLEGALSRFLPIPRRYERLRVRRYGFHGLSYTYLLEELKRRASPEVANGRVILAHLGNGASLAAVREGRCLDTSMGFTPAAGLVLGSRCGDLDPGLFAYLARTESMTADQFDELVNQKSGMLGVSEISFDMRDLLAREESESHATDAVALFCYQAKRWIGSFAAVLGGVDTIVFSGGIPYSSWRNGLVTFGTVQWTR